MKESNKRIVSLITERPHTGKMQTQIEFLWIIKEQSLPNPAHTQKQSFFSIDDKENESINYTFIHWNEHT